MVTTPREFPLDINVRITGLDDDDPRAEGWKVLERRIAQLIAAEVETRVAREREGLLRILGWAAYTYRQDGTGQAELRVPDAAMIGDDLEVTTWFDRVTRETVYQVRRRA